MTRLRLYYSDGEGQMIMTNKSQVSIAENSALKGFLFISVD